MNRNHFYVVVRMSMYCAWAVLFLFCCNSRSYLAFASSAQRTITLTATDVDGTNTGTVPLGYTSTIVPTTTGATNSSVIWKLNGAGWLSPSGVYWPPADMPSNTGVSVTAAIPNSTVAATYRFTLTNPLPAIRGSSPAQLVPGSTNQIQVLGSHFVKTSTVFLNGRAVVTTYKSSTTLVVNVPVAAVGATPVTLQVRTPAPAGGSTSALTVPVAAESVALAVTSSDGTTNSGAAPVGGWIHIVPTVVAPYNQNVTWKMTGAGSLAVGGWYHSPAAMPSSPNVTVTVALVANPAVFASYKFSIVNAMPAINQMRPAQLPTDITSQVTLVGSGFFPGTKLLLNGVPVSSSYQSSCCISVQIPVPDNALAPISIQAINPSPGGGASAVFAAPIQLKRTSINAYNATGTNPTAVTLLGEVQFLNSIVGPGDPSATWSVRGGGDISPTGLYHAPAEMSAGSMVTITSALVSNPAVTASYQLSLLNSVPTINGSSPARLLPASQNTVILHGTGFTPSTTLLVGGHPLPVAYQSSTEIKAQIATAIGQTGYVALVAQNPSPGGGAGNVFQITLGSAGSAAAQVSLQPGRAIPLDFVGLSHEWNGLSWLLGTPSTQVNAIYRQLISNLMNGARYPFFIRVGGDSSDSTAEMSSSTADALTDLAKAIDVEYSLGVNMASDSPQLAAQQAAFYLAKLPAGSVATIELGNEPDNYGYHGQRPNPYSTSSFLADYTNWSNAVLPVLPKYTGFMGPAWASASNLQQHLGSFEAGEGHNVPIISQHIYGGYQDGGVKFSSDYLLTSTAATQGPRLVASGVTLAHQAGQLFRVGEINSIDGSGVVGISDAFGSALWAIDTMFEYASVGVDGVNWHGNVNNAYCAFGFENTNVNGNDPYILTKVAPLYYGMLFFQLAAPNNAQLLPVAVQANANLKVWATEDKTGTVRVVILNKDKTFAGNVSVLLPGYGAASTLQMLAPSYESNDGITIGGQTFDGSADGKPVGSQFMDSILPSNGTYTVPVQPTSAVLLTMSH